MESELRPERILLNDTFEGYKLNPSGLETLSKALVTKVHNPQRDPSLFTYNYTKQQVMQNHLFYNKWNDSVYFVEENLNVAALILSEKGDVSSTTVLQLEKEEQFRNKFSATLLFPSKDLCLASTGSGILQLINIPKDPKNQWIPLSTGPVHDFQTPISLLNSHFDTNTSTLHVIVLSLKDFTEETEKTPVSYVLLHWLQISLTTKNDVECCVRDWKTFKSKSIPKNCWLSEDYTQFIVASESDIELVNVTTYERIQVIEQSNGDEAVDNIKYYHWHQCKEMVTIIFDIDVTEDEVDCQISHNAILLKLKSGKVLLGGSFEKPVLKDASKWYISNKKLEVVLVKKISGEFWSTIVPNEKHGIHDIEGEELERLNQIHKQMEHLTSDGINRETGEQKHFNMQQLEECDENMDEDVKIYTVNVFTGKNVLQKSLSGIQWLFSKSTSNNDAVPLICLRHDVDGILWQPDRMEQNKWGHIATFDAFGYVLASKQEHKFVTCGPSLDYTVITDCSSNVYIYQCKQGVKTKTRAQYVANFPDGQIILGCVAAKNVIYLLKDTHINIVHLPNE